MKVPWVTSVSTGDGTAGVGGGKGKVIVLGGKAQCSVYLKVMRNSQVIYKFQGLFKFLII